MNINFKQSRENFISEHQEKKPLLIRAAFDPAKFSWQEANDIFGRSTIESKDFKLSLNGIRPKHEYVESYMDVGTEPSLYKTLPLPLSQSRCDTYSQ